MTARTGSPLREAYRYVYGSGDSDQMQVDLVDAILISRQYGLPQEYTKTDLRFLAAGEKSELKGRGPRIDLSKCRSRDNVIYL